MEDRLLQQKLEILEKLARVKGGRRFPMDGIGEPLVGVNPLPRPTNKLPVPSPAAPPKKKK